MYALNELNSLLARLPSKVDLGDPVLRYLGAIFAELAYYHVPQWEIDNKKRALLIPCDAYQEIVQVSRSPDVISLLRQTDNPEATTFVLEGRGTIVVGVRVRRLLFLGFRGTQFLFDWPINLRSTRISMCVNTLPEAKFHRGFAIEAMRISALVREEMFRLGHDSFDQVVLSGHSLGGAVAGISSLLLPVRAPQVCIMGSPRFANLPSYSGLYGHLPVQVRRPGDGVPTVPPRWFGYADHPHEIATDGKVYLDPEIFAGLSGEVARWLAFVARLVKPHSMELYRKEMGEAAGASMADVDLAPYERLTSSNVKTEQPAMTVFRTSVYIQADETARWDFENQIEQLDTVELQSRYIRPNPVHPQWARFMIFASQMPSDDQIKAIAHDLGIAILMIEAETPC